MAHKKKKMTMNFEGRNVLRKNKSRGRRRSLSSGFHIIPVARRDWEFARRRRRGKLRVSSVSLNGSSGSRMYSVVPSNTRLSKGSNPFRTPEDSRPPENLTRIVLSKYFERSKMDSFFFFSPPPGPRSPPPFFSSWAPDMMNSQSLALSSTNLNKLKLLNYKLPPC